MTRPIDFDDLATRLSARLRRGTATPAELQADLRISQASFSRLVSALPGFVMKIGRGKAIRYALMREIAGLEAPIPVHRVGQDGVAVLLGTLQCLANDQWAWMAVNEGGAAGQTELFDGLPYFIQDMRPQGFLGRGFPARHRDLGLPEHVDRWHDEHVVVALAKRGEDTVGNLILGTESLMRFLRDCGSPFEVVELAARGERYLAMAAATLEGEPPGSSAGGEQPKFAAVVADRDGQPVHVLVKFSSAEDSAHAARWRDLLLAEHVALRTLRDAGVPAAQSEVLDVGGRRFLEVRRFDRCDRFGRVGLVSLAAMDDHFFGRRDTWTSAAQRFAQAKLIKNDDAQRLCYLHEFGRLIGNTDMHFGNASLLRDGAHWSVAPIYDMLPMLYAPTSSGDLPERVFEPGLPTTAAALAVWDRAVEDASRFWGQLAAERELSLMFQRIATENAAKLDRLPRTQSAVRR